jgi:hypothetical protein
MIFGEIFTDVTGPKENTLCECVKTVKRVLRKFKLGGTRFSIMGGCVNDIIDGRHFKDIDVFFHSKEDVDRIIDMFKSVKDVSIVYESKNAISIMNDGTIVQFVTIVYGSIDEIFSTFDFNGCEVAYTDSGELIKSQRYSKLMKCNTQCISTSVLQRYIRYKDYKGCIDEDLSEFKKIVNVLVKKLYDVIKKSYDTDQDHVGLDVLRTFLNRNHEISYQKIIHDELCNYYSGDGLIQAFKKIRIDDLSSTDLSIEAVVARHEQIRRLRKDKLKEAIYIYPEYFI